MVRRSSSPVRYDNPIVARSMRLVVWCKLHWSVERAREQVVAAYEDVHGTWQRLSRDGHIGMSDAFQIVVAAANTDSGRRALAEILTRRQGRHHRRGCALISPDQPRRSSASRGRGPSRRCVLFGTRFYTGTRLSKTHRVRNPQEFLYFNFAIVMLVGTLDDVAAVREQMRGSGYDPVIVAHAEASEKAIGIVMVNEFRDTTFGPYNEVVFIASAFPEDSPRQRQGCRRTSTPSRSRLHWTEVRRHMHSSCG